MAIQDNFRAFRKEIDSRIFENAKTLFPLMSFRDYKGGYASRLKLDLTDGRRSDKVVITPKVPGRALEQGGDAISTIDLYMHLQGISDFGEAVKEICSKVGLPLPTKKTEAELKEHKKKQSALEALCQRMRKALFAEAGKETLNYLQNVRGYSQTEAEGGLSFIDFAELGYIDGRTAKEAEALFPRDENGRSKVPYGTGSLYTLSIPYRSGGEIKGFVFRTIFPDTDARRLNKEGGLLPKYKDVFINEYESKKYHLFGLTGKQIKDAKERELIVVEGELDALRASYFGIPNVVAMSSGTLTEEALTEAKRIGVRAITLLFDTESDTEKQRQNHEKARKAIERIQREEIDAYVCYLPSEEGKKQDVDSFLTKAEKAKELREIIRKAKSAAIWLFENLCDITPYISSDKNLRDFARNVIDICNAAGTNEVDRQEIFRRAEAYTEGILTEEYIRKEADEKKRKLDAIRQREKALIAAETLKGLFQEGNLSEGFAYAEREFSRLQNISREGELSRLLVTPTAEEVRRSFREIPKGIKTNYVFQGKGVKDMHLKETLFLPAGALTFIGAPTSHGKSRFLENLAINLVRGAYGKGEGSVLYFSFEEDMASVRLQLLNIFLDMQIANGTNGHSGNLSALGAYYRESTCRFFKSDICEIEEGGVKVPGEEFEEREEAFLSLFERGKLKVYYQDYDSSDLITAIRYIAEREKVRAVFVDYVQLLHKRGARLQRKDELQEICRDLRTLAIETRLPIVLAAQVNRETKSPADMDVHNISEASDIEHSANVIVLLWNSSAKFRADNSYYANASKRNLTEEGENIKYLGFEPEERGKLYALLAKNRAGVRNVHALFDFDENKGTIRPKGGEPFPEEEEEEEEREPEATQTELFLQSEEKGPLPDDEEELPF